MFDVGKIDIKKKHLTKAEARLMLYEYRCHLLYNGHESAKEWDDWFSKKNQLENALVRFLTGEQ